MSRTEIPTNAPLLAAATSFGSSFLNDFIFKLGMKIITFLDLATLFGLQLDREGIDLTFNIDTTSFNSITIKSTDNDPFLKSYCHKKDEVTLSQSIHLATGPKR